MATLYRDQNNGVHAVITQETLDSLRRRHTFAMNYSVAKSRRNPYDLYDEYHPYPTEIATFVRARDIDHYRGFVTGTLDDLDRLAIGHTLVESPLTITVPFSNGRFAEESRYVLSPDQVERIFGHRLVAK